MNFFYSLDLQPIGTRENYWTWSHLEHPEPVEDVVHMPSVISHGDLRGTQYRDLGVGPGGNWHGTSGPHARAVAVEPW